MILYDQKEDLMIVLKEIEVNSNMMNHNQLGPIEQSVRLTLSIDYLNWAKEWMKSAWDQTSNIRASHKVLSKFSSEYKRNIFITNKVDMKFVGCFIKTLSVEEDIFNLELTCDYHEIGGNFPELKQIFRDKKIDQILN